MEDVEKEIMIWATNEVQDLVAKVRFVIEMGDLWGEEGVFCFPDGDIWHK